MSNDNNRLDDFSKSAYKNCNCWIWLLVLGVAVSALAVAGSYLWFKGQSANEMEHRLSEEKARLETTLKQQNARLEMELKQSAEADLIASRKDWLLTLAKPLSWALRQSVLASNASEIDAYVVELIKMPAFDRIVMTSRDGTVVVASDRKMLDMYIDDIYPAEVKDVQTSTVLAGPEGRLVLVIPVMGSTEKLGIFALTFDPQAKAKPEIIPATSLVTPH